MRTANPPERLKDRFARLDWARAHRTPIQMRYSDTDALGHLNNAVYVQYLETSRVYMMRDLQAQFSTVPFDDLTVVARLELDYVQEIKMGQQVVVETLIGEIGTKSWSNLSRIVADDLPCAFAIVVDVRVNADHQSIPLEGPLREVLTPYLARELEDTHAR